VVHDLTIDAGTRTVRRLKSELDGRVIVPDDTEYEEARRVYFTSVDRRPAAIVKVANAGDVMSVIRRARDAGLAIAVRSGGHSMAAHGVSDGGIVIDLSAMRAMEIDVAAGTAWADTGITAGAYTTQAGAHGLATGFGDAPSVGTGGITLGGGVGFLHRKHGLTIDQLIAAEMVTADGDLVQADALRNPDLFWAIRGGGGNFGVATRFRFRLSEVGTVFGGMLLLPATPETIAAAVGEALAAPDELCGMISVMPAPPMPFLAPEHHGRIVVMALLVYAGDVHAGERALAPFRALAAPLADMLRPMPYPSIYDGHENAPHPAAVAVRNFFTDTMDRTDAEAIIDGLRTSSAPMRVVQVRVLGGAVARVAPAATAFAHRLRPMMVNVAAMVATREERPAQLDWAVQLADRLRHGEPAAYVGFMADEGPARVHEAYPAATLQRLGRIKRRYDPDNVFRLNQNVLPAW
jgi:FAD/FMN-containing dehydrogenase